MFAYPPPLESALKKPFRVSLLPMALVAAFSHAGAYAADVSAATTFEMASSAAPELGSELTSMAPIGVVDPTLILPAIPEPATVSLLFGGLLLLMVLQRRARR